MARMQTILDFCNRDQVVHELVHLYYGHYHTKKLHQLFHDQSKLDPVMVGAGGWASHCARRTLAGAAFESTNISKDKTAADFLESLLVFSRAPVLACFKVS